MLLGIIIIIFYFFMPLTSKQYSNLSARENSKCLSNIGLSTRPKYFLQATVHTEKHQELCKYFKEYRTWKKNVWLV